MVALYFAADCDGLSDVLIPTWAYLWQSKLKTKRSSRAAKNLLKPCCVLLH